MIRTICLSVLLAAGALASLGQSIHAQTVQAVRTSPLAQDAPQVHAMLSGLRIYEILSLMAREHIAGGADLEAQLFPGQGGAGWQFAVSVSWAAAVSSSTAFVRVSG